MSYTRQEIADSSVIKHKFSDYSNERALLSLAISNEDLFYSLIAKVTVDDFLSEDTKQLYHILIVAQQCGVKKFDVPSLISTAKDLGYKEFVDYEFLSALIKVPVDESNFELYLAKLVDTSTKYKLYTSLLTHSTDLSATAGRSDSYDSNTFISRVQTDILTLSMDSVAVEEPKHIGEGLDEYIKSIEATKVETLGLSTGFPFLDKSIDGLIPGTLLIIAARKKMGKSTLLTNIAANVAIKNQKAVLYVDTEMTFNEWRGRVLAIMSGVEERVIKHGGFKSNKEIYERVLRAVKYLKQSKLFHFYLPGYSVDKIAALYKKYKLKEDIQLGIFDYIKEPDLSSVDKGRKEHQILGDVTTKLKDLSGQLDIPFLAAVQLSRAGDVADSDRIARYADVIAFWGLRDLKEAEENAWDLDEIGHYGLYIKDSRRGGTTGSAGIGYKFIHSKLTIKEVPLEHQVEKYLFSGGASLDTGTFTGATEDISANNNAETDKLI
jgi:replicative DNA helicase